MNNFFNYQLFYIQHVMFYLNLKCTFGCSNVNIG